MYHFLGALWSCLNASHVFFIQSVVLDWIYYCGQDSTTQFSTAPTDLSQHPRKPTHSFSLFLIFQSDADDQWSFLVYFKGWFPLSSEKCACWHIIWCVTSDNHSPPAGKPETEILLWQRGCALAILATSCASPVFHQVFHVSCTLPHTRSLIPVLHKLHKTPIILAQIHWSNTFCCTASKLNCENKACFYVLPLRGI